MKTVVEFLTEYNEKHNLPVDHDSLRETLIEGTIVHRGDRDTHRWYITEVVVTKIGDTYIEYLDYIITGDQSMSDMDLHYDLNSARIVERKERQIIEVYYES